MNRLLVGGAVAALALSVSTAPAAGQVAPPPGVAQGTTPVAPVRAAPQRPQLRERVHIMTMSDRTLTRDEVVRHVREMFARLDANKDGYVTREEMQAFHRRFADMGGGIHGRVEEHGAIMADRARMFDRMDTNHDGVISRQEFMAARPLMRERRVMMMREDAAMPRVDRMPMRGMGMHRMGVFGGRLFEMADANHDGRVSLQEAEAAALAHFDRMDLNHDGKVTPEERRKAHELMRREHRPG